MYILCVGIYEIILHALCTVYIYCMCIIFEMRGDRGRFTYATGRQRWSLVRQNLRPPCSIQCLNIVGTANRVYIG